MAEIAKVMPTLSRKVFASAKARNERTKRTKPMIRALGSRRAPGKCSPPALRTILVLR